MGGCGGLENTDFNSFYFGGVWWLLKELIFNSFLIWESVVVLTETDFLHIFYFGESMVALKKTEFLIISTFGECGDHKSS